MGNETSFQGFPAHVHNAVVQRVQYGEDSTHVVHTKIYPRYKSKYKIEVARDAFSDWLAPHEDANTDIILLGHSLGGILSAEVALKPALAGEHKLYCHRIFGAINFDTPFLGMHPGVISSGLGSLFRPAPDTFPPVTPDLSRIGSVQSDSVASNAATEGSNDNGPYFQSGSSTSSFMPTETPLSATSTTTLPLSSPLDLPTKDPNYDPPFTNDVRRPQRSGWSNAWHFINKHSDGLAIAAKSYVTSHFEFGGCLADYNGLKHRYAALKDLEDGHTTDGTRCRFVNYYTASTGRPKKIKSPAEGVGKEQAQAGQVDGGTAEMEERVEEMSFQADKQAAVTSPRISIERAADDSDDDFTEAPERQHLSVEEDVSENGSGASDVSTTMQHMDPAPIEEEDKLQNAEEEYSQEEPTAEDGLESINSTSAADALSPQSTVPQPTQEAIPLPPIPALPEAPAPFDPAPYTDKDTRKLAEKEHARTVKTYERAVKDRDRAIKDRRKLIEKREAAAKKEQLKSASAKEKEQLKSASAKEKEQLKAEVEAAKKEAKEKEKIVKKEQARAEKERKEKVKKGSEEERLEKEEERMERERRRMNGEKEEEEEEEEEKAKPLSKTTSLAPSTSKTSTMEGQTYGGVDDNKPKRDKKFCLLPPMVNGKPDPCWIRVFMPGVDEVGAHCGLFFVDGQRYEWFVGDVAERIEGWVAVAQCGRSG